jgi:hypothetical protein
MPETWITDARARGRHNADEVRSLPIHIAQCDLAGHSEWFADCHRRGDGNEAFRARKQLEERMTERMAPLFWCFAWQGDGGIFVALEMPAPAVVDQLQAMLDEFKDWQATWQSLEGTEGLALRVSGHLCTALVDSSLEHFVSPDINRFMKYERDIGRANAIAVTHAIYHSLDDPGRFVASKDLHVGGLQTWRIYYDDAGAVAAERSQVEAIRRRYDLHRARGVRIESQRFQIDDAIALLVSPSPRESIDIDLVSLGRATDDEFRHLESPRWLEERDRLRGLLRNDTRPELPIDSLKVSPVSVRIPLTDFPLASIEYLEVPYSTTRSFLTTISGDGDATRSELLNHDVGYVPAAPVRPGILVAHVALVCQATTQPLLILSQRSTRQPDGLGFLQGRWSASMEEQLSPADDGVRAGIARGLREELHITETDGIECHAACIFIEESLLNLGVAAVCRTDLTFSELHDRWQDAEDRDENSKIVGVPLTDDTTSELIRTLELGPAVRNAMSFDSEYEYELHRNDAWRLHPTAALRIALTVRS